MTDNIGWWTARFSDERQLSSWHFVESQIDDRLITRCGRQMHMRTPDGHLLTASEPESGQCKRCHVGASPSPERIARAVG